MAQVGIKPRTSISRAFSDLFGKFLVPMKLGKNCDFGNKIQRFGEKIVQFLAKWESLPFKLGFFCSLGIFQVNWDFFSQLGKNLVRKPDPVLYREKALISTVWYSTTRPS